MMLVMVLDGVTLFLFSKDLTHTKVCKTVQLLKGFLQDNGGKLEEAEDFKCGFVVITQQITARADLFTNLH